MRPLPATVVARTYTGVVTISAGMVVASLFGDAARGSYEVLANVRLGIHHLAVLAAANTYFVSREPALFPAAAGNSLAVGLGAGTALALGLVALKLLVPSWIAPAGTVGAVAFLAAAPAILSTQLLAGAFLGAGRIGAWNGVIVANRTVVLAGLVVASTLAPWRSISTVLVALALGEWVALVVALRGASRAGGLRPRLDGALLRRMARYGAVASLHLLLSFGLVRTDVFLLERLSGSAEAGQYAVAALFRDVVVFLPWVASLLVLPRVAGDPSDRGTHARALAAPALAVATVLAAGLWVGAPWVVPALHGEGFGPAVGLARVTIPGGLFAGISYLVFQDLLGRGAPRAVLWIPGAGLLLLVAADVAWIPTDGAAAAAWVSTGVAAVVCALALAAFRVHSRRPTA